MILDFHINFPLECCNFSSRFREPQVFEMKENIKSTDFSCNFATETPHASNINEMCEE